MKFDLAIAFDKAKYLEPQVYMFVDSIKDKLPEGTILHVVTNRGKEDSLRKYIKNTVPSKFYYEKEPDELNSRCRYMLNVLKIKTDKPWVIKVEADMLALRHLSALEEMLDDEYDIIIESENRRIFTDEMETRLWRMLYREMKVKCPTETITYREDDKIGLPLFGTGMFCVKSKYLDLINKKWIPYTKICERWLHINVHPNEQAIGGIIFGEGLKWKIYPREYKWNPIGIWRKGTFPSIELIDNCILPEEVVFLDYHRPKWLYHVAKFNPNVKEIVDRNSSKMSKEWKDLTNKDFQETI